MKDSKLKAAQLIDRYLDGTCTDQERQLVEQVYSKVALAKILEDSHIDFSGIGRESWAYIAAETAGEVGAGLEIGSGRYNRTGLEVRYEPEVTLKSRPMFRLWRGVAAAVAVVAITLGTWLYYPTLSSRVPRDLNRNAIHKDLNDIAPGHNTATITLADGTVINLDTNRTGVVFNSDDLTYADGTSVTSSLLSSSSLRGKHSDEAISQTLTASTPRGGTYQFVLPDGTKAWLNAASSIRFPSSFAGTQRRSIEMTGEVYLEVAKDRAHPFIVKSRGQEVEVLGTHFNINAYTDESNVKTTLLEGSVKVSSLQQGSADASSLRGRAEASRSNLPGRGPSTTQGVATTLKPGQQSILSNTNRIEIKQVNTAEAIAWKEGNFVFNNEDIETIMRHIARWYNIEVKYEGILPAGEFSGNVSRSKNISQVLQALELTKLVHFKVEGRTVVVTK